jgi:SH3-like domain-containing protein
MMTREFLLLQTGCRMGQTLPWLGTSINNALAFFIAVLALTNPVYAADFVSVTENAVVLYDKPNTQANKVYVVSRFMPLEQVVSLENWVKVRDRSGGMAWIEKRFLSGKRYVYMTAALVAMHQSPEDKSPVVTQVKQQVALELLENTDTGWLKVRHLDGTTGYVKATEVWGD